MKIAFQIDEAMMDFLDNDSGITETWKKIKLDQQLKGHTRISSKYFIDPNAKK